MPTTTTTAEGLLNEVILPYIERALTDESEYLKRIDKSGKHVTPAGKRYKWKLLYQRNQGIGVAKEGGALPTAGAAKAIEPYDDYTAQYAAFNFTGQAMAADTGKGSPVDLVALDIKETTKAFKKDIERQLLGDSTCRLAQVADADPDSASTLYVDNSLAIANRIHLEPGMDIDFMEAEWVTAMDTDPKGNLTSGTDYWASASGIQIDTVGTDDTGDYVTLIDEDAAAETCSSNVADDDWITRKGAIDTSTTTKSGNPMYLPLEITGLQHLVDDCVDVDLAQNYIGSLSRATYPSLISLVQPSVGALTEENLAQYLAEANATRGGEYDFAVTTHAIHRRFYFNELAPARRFNALVARKMKTGLPGIGYQWGNQVVDIWPHNFAGAGTMIMMKASDVGLAELTSDGAGRGMHWVQDKRGKGSILRVVSGYDKYEAELAWYINQFALNPFTLMKLEGITES